MGSGQHEPQDDGGRRKRPRQAGIEGESLLPEGDDPRRARQGDGSRRRRRRARAVRRSGSSRVVSTITSLRMWRRLAPIAWRTASSLIRPLARIRRRLTRLTAPISEKGEHASLHAGAAWDGCARRGRRGGARRESEIRRRPSFWPLGSFASSVAFCASICDLGLGESGAWSQAGDHLDDVAAEWRLRACDPPGCEASGKVEPRLGGKEAEARRQDADHGPGKSVHANLLARSRAGRR